VSGIAIFHDNLVQMGGAERVTQALAAAFPGAALHTTIASLSKLSAELRNMRPRATWMRYLPAPDRLYRHYFMLYPLAVETADLRQYDVVVSNCWGYAKGVHTRPDALHVCYCQTPPRWAWRYNDYVAREDMSRMKRLVLPWLIQPLRQWDLRAARRPDFFIANSHTAASRIRTLYGRESEVIYPPIDVDRFTVGGPPGDYYLIVSRLIAYKRIDLAIGACAKLGRRLVVIGGGPDRARLERLAGPSVEFLGRVSDEVVSRMTAGCRALLFPGEEDFGIVPLEANASGRPVVAWRGGGALETVREGETGVFFDEPTPESMAAAILALEQRSWEPACLRHHAEAFDRQLFIDKIRGFLRRTASSRPAQRALEAVYG